MLPFAFHHSAVRYSSHHIPRHFNHLIWSEIQHQFSVSGFSDTHPWADIQHNTLHTELLLSSKVLLRLLRVAVNDNKSCLLFHCLWAQEIHFSIILFPWTTHRVFLSLKKEWPVWTNTRKTFHSEMLRGRNILSEINFFFLSTLQRFENLYFFCFLSWVNCINIIIFPYETLMVMVKSLKFLYNNLANYIILRKYILNAQNDTT